jgi:glycylpeptide N-tetradecanoyltransferase
VPQPGAIVSEFDGDATDGIPGDEAPDVDGYIESPKPPEEVRQDAFPLPKDFEWSTLDISDPKQVRSFTLNRYILKKHLQNKEVYDLLSLNYVEDTDASFRFQYSAEFLQWYVIDDRSYMPDARFRYLQGR